MENNLKVKKKKSLSGGEETYSLVKDTKRIMDFMKSGSSQSEDSYRIVQNDDNTPIDDRNYTKVYDGFTVFKRKFFKCTKIEYSDETGRVNKLEFVEIIPTGGTLEGYN